MDVRSEDRVMIQKHWKDTAVFTDALYIEPWEWGEIGKKVPEGELLPGELSAVTFPALALRDDVLLGADLQQFKIPVDHIKLAQTIGRDHHFIVGILDSFCFDLNVGCHLFEGFLQ